LRVTIDEKSVSRFRFVVLERRSGVAIDEKNVAIREESLTIDERSVAIGEWCVAIDE
jgi:hypothetical protein